jgi:hypothetical protein
MRQVLSELEPALLGPLEGVRRSDAFASDLLAFVQLMKQNLVHPSALMLAAEASSGERLRVLAAVYQAYQLRLQGAHMFDFRDLISGAIELLQSNTALRENLRQRFRLILVDEFQDVDPAQFELLRLVAPPAAHPRLVVVGDPDQSVYGFRGADINNILDFERDFPGTRTIALEQNYRSTNSILDAANNVISNNRERKPKELWSELGDGEPVRVLEVEDEHAEARFVAAGIAGLVEEGFSGDEVAIFYRTNAQSRVLEDVLVRQGVAYQVIGGPRFYERAEIKDLIAYLQVIDNPYDAVSLMRVANRPRPRARNALRAQGGRPGARGLMGDDGGAARRRDRGRPDLGSGRPAQAGAARALRAVGRVLRLSLRWLIPRPRAPRRPSAVGSRRWWAAPANLRLATSSVAPIRLTGMNTPCVLPRLGSRRPGHHGDVESAIYSRSSPRSTSSVRAMPSLRTQSPSTAASTPALSSAST